MFPFLFLFWSLSYENPLKWRLKRKYFSSGRFREIWGSLLVVCSLLNPNARVLLSRHRVVSACIRPSQLAVSYKVSKYCASIVWSLCLFSHVISMQFYGIYLPTWTRLHGCYCTTRMDAPGFASHQSASFRTSTRRHLRHLFICLSASATSLAKCWKVPDFLSVD